MGKMINRNIRPFIYFYSHLQKKKLEPIDKNNPIAKWVPYMEVANLLTHTNDKEFFNNSIKKIINET